MLKTKLKAHYIINVFDDVINYDVLICETIDNWNEEREIYSNEKSAEARVEQVNNWNYGWETLPMRK